MRHWTAPIYIYELSSIILLTQWYHCVRLAFFFLVFVVVAIIFWDKWTISVEDVRAEKDITIDKTESSSIGMYKHIIPKSINIFVYIYPSIKNNERNLRVRVKLVRLQMVRTKTKHVNNKKRKKNVQTLTFITEISLCCNFALHFIQFVLLSTNIFTFWIA